MKIIFCMLISTLFVGIAHGKSCDLEIIVATHNEYGNETGSFSSAKNFPGEWSLSVNDVDLGESMNANIPCQGDSYVGWAANGEVSKVSIDYYVDGELIKSLSPRFPVDVNQISL